jgi:hypothetical protein
MIEALVGDGFVRELIALRDRYHTKQHRFFDRWVAGAAEPHVVSGASATVTGLGGDRCHG